MKRLLCGLLPLLLCACIGWPSLPDLPKPGWPSLPRPSLGWLWPDWLWFGAGPSRPQPVDDREVLAFASRIEGFYLGLEAIPLDVKLTYEDTELRSHFADATSFADYYASLAYQVRRAQLRNSRVERIEIHDFQFEDDDRVRVQLVLVGHHQRGLRFWELELPRTDTWRRIEGAWVLTPEGL